MNVVAIKDYLSSRGLKYKWLAEQIGISESYMSLLISGKRNWNKSCVDRTASVLDIKSERLLQMLNQNIVKENGGGYGQSIWRNNEKAIHDRFRNNKETWENNKQRKW